VSPPTNLSSPSDHRQDSDFPLSARRRIVQLYDLDVLL
jgi:hypothetical protein